MSQDKKKPFIFNFPGELYKISYNNFSLITEVANKTREYFVLKRCSSSDIFGFYSREVDIICMSNGTGKTYS